MKTLIFNGSPRKDGDTACLIREMKTALKGEITEVSAYRDDISPCVDCRSCWDKDGCAIQDGMQAVYAAMNDYDNIIVASPIYFSRLTGEMMSLASRFQCLYAAKRFRGIKYGGKKKNGVLILAGGGDGKTEPAEDEANLFFRYANAMCIGKVMSLNTDRVPACRDEEAKEKARELAVELNRLSFHSTQRFTGKAEGYAKYRPRYAEEYLDYLIAVCGLTGGSEVADVGAGTGILTEQLLDRGLRVTAVEPNADMRAQAEQKLTGRPGFRSVDGAAEQTGLESGSVDLVTAAQAFHWFNREAFGAECRRILKPGGIVSLVWNSRMRTSPIAHDIDETIRQFCPDYVGTGKGIEDEAGVFERFFKDGVFEFRSFRNDAHYDLEGFIGRNLSLSDAPREKDRDYKPYIGKLDNLFARYSENGIVTVPSETHSYTGKV